MRKVVGWGFGLASICVVVQAEDSQKLVVKGEREEGDSIYVERETNPLLPDIGQALAALPGADFNQNGRVTVLPQYRGHIGSRTGVSIDGFPIVSAGPNLMDAPLSYSIPAWAQEVILYRGIAPVASGLETLGSQIEVINHKPEFNSHEGEFSGFYHGAFSDAAKEQALAAGWANNMHRFQWLASDQTGDDVESPLGTLAATEFDKNVNQIGYGFKVGQHQLDLEFAKQDVDESGTPALGMDIRFIDGERTGLHYQTEWQDVSLSIKAFDMEAQHGMDNFTLRTLMMPTMARYSYATSEGDGVHIALDWQNDQMAHTFGVEQKDSLHNMVVTNPNNPMFRVKAFSNASREDLSVYWQSNLSLDESQSINAGIRYKKGEVNSDSVSHHMFGMMPPVTMLQNSFNQSQRERSFSDIDWSLNYHYQVSDEWKWYLGVGQKNRLPTYQELYLWLPLAATAGLADGNLYMGDRSLESEQATQFEIGFTWQNDVVKFSPQIFYHDLKNYIQGINETNTAALMFANMMMPGSQVLRFANVDGSMKGLDAELLWQINELWWLESTLSIVRGERDDVNDNLYRIAPDNVYMKINYQHQDWTFDLSGQVYAKQDDVSQMLSEQPTSGYGVLNFGAQWQLNASTLLSFAISNLSDKEYVSHLSGYNRVMSSAVAPGQRILGAERQFVFSINRLF
ncbi:TonB-dependent receptor [Pleionea sp. CnH1-48]|uniref:TonB-dependent receptor n=1 Tax=Pleionea sp. CnH1-48 TaxID=2954494 RepID=UPI00209795E9|nr:TonB-dependent receptor [Pleionea sp. CnH1-48]MCO7224850.1 TonB-dependent receptor [Pleionea sp. CnH1-48]